MPSPSPDRDPREPHSPSDSARGVPQDDGVDPEQALAWLERFAKDPEQLAHLEEPLRIRLRRAAGALTHMDVERKRQFVKERRRLKKRQAQQQTRTALETTSNRAKKRALRFPTAPPDLDMDAHHRALLEEQAQVPEDLGSTPEQPRLAKPKGCYACKEPFVEVHHHYDSMCPACAELNWLKRHQTADLRGRVALVTGSRVKIGYEICLMLLRAGCRVIATTRFPVDAAERFAEEKDYADWRERLELHGLDLRHTPSVEWFADRLVQTESRLDFLIHNACQTVRRPPEFYQHLIEKEARGASPGQGARLLAAREALLNELEGESAGTDLQAKGAPHLPGVRQASHLSQLDLLGEGDQFRLFPQGMIDGEGQQLDLRAANSWRMELHQVPTVELLEVQLVNSVAPFVLNARLKPLLLAVETPDKHIVNVSAMEGQFNRHLKTTRHPHTNMAKAALNMMTRTSAKDYVRDGIHMNSVDTGWVTDEDPFELTVRKASDQNFTPPLDSIDGAARVLDPIFTGFLTGVHCWGQFLKDYKPAPW